MKLELAFDYKAALYKIHWNSKDYLIVGQKVEDEDEEGEGDEWEGTVRRLTRKIHKSTDTIKKMFA